MASTNPPRHAELQSASNEQGIADLWRCEIGPDRPSKALQPMFHPQLGSLEQDERAAEMDLRDACMACFAGCSVDAAEPKLAATCCFFMRIGDVVTHFTVARARQFIRAGPHMTHGI